MKRFALTLMLGTALMSPVWAAEPGIVGIALPDTSPRWAEVTDAMVKIFTEAGYDIDLRPAEGDAKAQGAALVASGVRVLVEAAVGDPSLAGHPNIDPGIAIAANDQPGGAPTDYAVAFDAQKAGAIGASAMLNGLAARFPKAQPWHILIVGAMPESGDPAAEGALSVVQSWADAGDIKVSWRNAASDILGATHQPLHGILVLTDGQTFVSLAAAQAAGYGVKGLPLPVIVGQDADAATIKALAAGEIAATIFKDERELAKAAAGVVNALMHGAPPIVTDGTTRRLVPVLVDGSNWRTVVIDSGYLDPEDLQ